MTLFLFRFRPRCGAAIISFAVAAVAVLLAFAAHPSAVRAAGTPTLTEIMGDDLPKALQPNRRYTFRLKYTDPNGDTIRKSDAVFTDEGPSAPVSTPATTIEGDDTAKGVIISWNINGFEQGAHKARFTVKSLTTTATYPADAASAPYEFVVEALSTKYITLGIGALVGFLFVPFVTVALFRMINPKSDPSRLARVGLLFGIMAFCALFIYLFASVYGPLSYAILILGILGAIVLLAGGRR